MCWRGIASTSLGRSSGSPCSRMWIRSSASNSGSDHGDAMSDHSKIEWTDATWNPVTGCTKVSPGCKHCYAQTFAERFRGVPGHPFEQGFDLRLWPERLGLPLVWKTSRRIFVNSMSDLFHERVPEWLIDAVFDTMSRAAWHQFQVLTKRPDLMTNYVRARADRFGPLTETHPNVW